MKRHYILLLMALPYDTNQIETWKICRKILISNQYWNIDNEEHLEDPYHLFDTYRTTLRLIIGNALQGNWKNKLFFPKTTIEILIPLEICQ